MVTTALGLQALYRQLGIMSSFSEGFLGTLGASRNIRMLKTIFKGKIAILSHVWSPVAGVDWGCDYNEINTWERCVFTYNNKQVLLQGFHSLC